MGYSCIQAREKILIYKEKNYDYMDFLKNIKVARKRIIVILDENLYINIVDIRCEKKTNEKIACETIKESFGNGNDLLFNYEVSQDLQKLYIYGVKGGIKLAELCKGASKIRIFPLQLLVVKKLKYRIQEKSWQCIFKYMNRYYYCSIIKGLVELTFIQENINIFNNKFQEVVNKEVLYLDNTINKLDINGMKDFNYIELGGILNEKVFSK
ncbi:hypothetical protein [Clostridium vincentii]|uniref:Uncharacterized protein n=1 Tax=Clostridium vincentii TaxID=52704 RepID=A0A2T0BGG2_9CLOT|nr:hypothetical protein [Clostridium vincentii]PRR82948.1 hypothetical protein CLVI_13910 [Clostridium vincentii]